MVLGTIIAANLNILNLGVIVEQICELEYVGGGFEMLRFCNGVKGYYCSHLGYRKSPLLWRGETSSQALSRRVFGYDSYSISPSVLVSHALFRRRLCITQHFNYCACLYDILQRHFDDSRYLWTNHFSRFTVELWVLALTD